MPNCSDLNSEGFECCYAFTKLWRLNRSIGHPAIHATMMNIFDVLLGAVTAAVTLDPSNKSRPPKNFSVGLPRNITIQKGHIWLWVSMSPAHLGLVLVRRQTLDFCKKRIGCRQLLFRSVFFSVTRCNKPRSLR